MKDIFYPMTFPDKKFPGQHVHLTCTHNCPGVLFPTFYYNKFMVDTPYFLFIEFLLPFFF